MSAPLKTFYLLVLTFALSLFMVGHNNNPIISPSPTLSPPIVLYDGSLGTLPDAQSFVYATDGIVTQTISSGVTTLDTTLDENTSAGYSTLPPFKPGPTMNRANGFTVRFTSQIISETHSSNDRAGFSVIVLSSDKRGIEIGFWQDKIWAQEYIAGGAQFIHAEEHLYNTTTPLTTYDLTILGDAYTLFVGTTPILSGKLRDYSPRGSVYNIPNFVFLGDDTTRAKAIIKLSYVSVSTYNLDPRQVTTIADTLIPAAQPVTLRQAILNNTSLSPTNLPITFDSLLGTNPTITLTDVITIPANTQILPADCTPTNKVTLKAIVSNVLQLGGNNYLRGLEILTPLGPAIKINSSGTGNKFECVSIKIG